SRILPKGSSHPFETPRTIGVDLDGPPSGPCVVDYCTVVQVMIGVMLGDENVAQLVCGNASGLELPRISAGTVTEGRMAVDQEQRGGVLAGVAQGRPALGADPDEACALFVAGRACTRGAARQGETCRAE